MSGTGDKDQIHIYNSKEASGAGAVETPKSLGRWPELGCSRDLQILGLQVQGLPTGH